MQPSKLQGYDYRIVEQLFDTAAQIRCDCPTENAQDVLKDHHKWCGVKVVKPGRRVRTTKDLEEPNELFRDDTIPRPPGKPRPSKSHF
ncbi:hypothetical protein Tco_0916023 [Tanacetum coccineum]